MLLLQCIKDLNDNSLAGFGCDNHNEKKFIFINIKVRSVNFKVFVQTCLVCVQTTITK